MTLTPSRADSPHLTELELAPVYPGDAADGCEVVGDSAPAQEEAERHGWRVLAILSALMGFASISTDVYLPAMPAMAKALHATAGEAEWTISGYLIGFSLGQLFWGPISDRMGRRLPVAIGLVLFAIGSMGCAVSGSIWALIACRVVQAIGASAGVVLGRAMVRDLFVGDHAARMLSTLMTVMAIAPLLGPIAGGQILHFAGWRYIFWALVGVGLVTLGALFTLPETLPVDRRNHEPFSRAVARYGELITQRRILGYAGASGFFYAGMFAFVAGTPFAYIEYHHLTPQLYSVVFAIGVLGIMSSNIINARSVTKLGGDTLLKRGAAIAAVAGVLAAFAAITDFGGLPGLAVPLFFFLSVVGFVIANSISGALAGFPERAGAVSALVGALQYGSGIIGSALVGAFADGTPKALGLVVAVTGLGSLLCAHFLIRPAPRM